ncbi:lipocalin [Sphingobacterium alkalisoli]|uniref:Lipocalin n=1 Tax=Sphingobacterium alkalisoli TaxID=1874115 RepID=A0A4U0H2G2_9SPHI|nr:lipocalin family protein [Sphingobacterium alkalisoli]TJY65658.1 lipocalin [Sphingobacterium alkalisoli]GGH19153.1 lipoprotein [Sphingobacterium alkalisoli]
MNKKKSLLALTAIAAGSVIYSIWKPVKSDLPVVQNLDLNKYLGKWYEIARLDFYWEKNLKNVTAEYNLNEDGSIGVNNQGFDFTKNKHKQSIGKAKFLRTPNEGALKVSFFGPFYSGYNIMHVDDNYRHALVFGENLDYIWILSREKIISDEIRDMYLAYAERAGYDVKKLVWTFHD